MAFHPDPHKCFCFDLPLTQNVCFDSCVLLDKPGLCRCEIRRIGSDPAYAEFELRENYPGRLPGSGDLAVEAEIFLTSREHPEWTGLRIGIPLSEIPETSSFQLVYDLATFRMMAGGHILAEEFPFGDPPGKPESLYVPEELPHQLTTLQQGLHTW